jgi:uridine kinase
MTSLILKVENADVRVTLERIDALKPHEKGSLLYFRLLRKEILKDTMLKYPIIADKKTLVILDGMHRWLALKSLGYEQIPVILVDSSKDRRICVGQRRINRYMYQADSGTTVKQVISAGTSGRLMEPRSTRHFFPFSKFQKIDYPLRFLKRGTPKSVSRYFSKTRVQSCHQKVARRDHRRTRVPFKTDRRSSKRKRRLLEQS